MPYFNPRTHRGVRLASFLVYVFPPLDFNPRTHRGVRHGRKYSRSIGIIISIHAPIVGCDMANAIELGKAIIFQSTHPSWGATVSTSPTIRSMQFQSTHPSWGATVVVLSINCCDVNFNPRTHRGVRPSVYHTCLISLLVNFNPRTHRGVRLQIHQSM